VVTDTSFDNLAEDGYDLFEEEGVLGGVNERKEVRE